jgi:hypothetical protein
MNCTDMHNDIIYNILRHLSHKESNYLMCLTRNFYKKMCIVLENEQLWAHYLHRESDDIVINKIWITNNKCTFKKYIDLQKLYNLCLQYTNII